MIEIKEGWKKPKSAGADYILTAVQWPTYFIPKLKEQSTINAQKQDLTVVSTSNFSVFSRSWILVEVHKIDGSSQTIKHLNDHRRPTSNQITQDRLSVLLHGFGVVLLQISIKIISRYLFITASSSSAAPSWTIAPSTTTATTWPSLGTAPSLSTVRRSQVSLISVTQTEKIK